MKIQTVAILSPGDMGHAIGMVLHHAGLRVMTNLQDRSQQTRAQAATAGMIDAGDDERLVREADIFLSILPPAQAVVLAERVASAVRATQTQLLFVDCNAISPRTMQNIEHLMIAAGIDVVDAGIIGSPPRPGKPGPRLYVSGKRAADVALLREYGLDIRVLGDNIGQASALKMCYASLTKGFTALASEALVAGRVLGVAEALSAELQQSQADFFRWIDRGVPGMPPKAYRWVGEMEEIAQTYADIGLPPQMLQGAAAVYRFIEQTEVGNRTKEGPRPRPTLDELTTILTTALVQQSRES